MRLRRSAALAAIPLAVTAGIVLAAPVNGQSVAEFYVAYFVPSGPVLVPATNPC